MTRFRLASSRLRVEIVLKLLTATMGQMQDLPNVPDGRKAAEGARYSYPIAIVEGASAGTRKG
jgi:hypothetical protein